MGLDPVALGVVVVVVMAALVWWATSYRDRTLAEVAARRPRAPRHLQLTVVEVGSMRYFDARTFPPDTFVGDMPGKAAVNAVAPHAAVAAHAWLLPRGALAIFRDLPDTVRIASLARLREAGRDGKAMVTFVHFTDGAPGAAIEASAKKAGVELMLEVAIRVGPDGTESDLALIDRAAGRPAPK